MANKFDNGPMTDFLAITPSDDPLTHPISGFYVGGAGNVVIKANDGTQITFTGCLAGVYYPFACTHVMAATSASNIVGLR